MKSRSFCGRWLGMLGLAAVLLAAPACQRHPYRIPDPQGPPRPKVKRGSGSQSADGRALDVEREAVKTKKKHYDKHELVKQPKYKRRRLEHPGNPDRRIFGIRLPF